MALYNTSRRHTVRVDSVKDISTKVILKVAEKSNRSPEELPPLNSAIASDAVDEIFTDPNQSETVLRFEYADHHVKVGPGKSVSVNPK